MVFKNKDFSLYKQVCDPTYALLLDSSFPQFQMAACDAKLLTVPDSVSRVPKTLFDYMHWKGNYMHAWEMTVTYSCH